MSDCPRCYHELERSRTDGGISWQCPDCGGLLATLPFLRRRLSVEAANRIWQTAREADPGSSYHECPFCGKDMVRVQTEFDGHGLELDACLRCQAFWFDKGEIEALPEAPPPPPPEPEPELSPETKEKLLAVEMQLVQEKMAADPTFGASSAGDTSGLPEPRRISWITWLLILASGAIWMSHGGASRRGWFLSLICQVWNLWVAGRPAEAACGGFRFLGMGLVFAALSAGIHWKFGLTEETLPLLMAETATGIIAWLSMRFPFARIAQDISRYSTSRRLRTVWVPISLVAVESCVMVFYTLSALNIDGWAGTPLALIVIWLAAFAFHKFGKK